MTKIWGHRGAYDSAPENTLPAFKLAVDMGADGVEFDIQLTKDNEIVVIHDEKIDKLSDSQGFVKDYTLSELKKFNFGGATFAQIPTLSEVLELLKPSPVDINIELKTGIIFYEGIEEKALKLVASFGMGDRIVWSSFNHLSVQAVKQLDPNAHTALLCGKGIFTTGEECAKTDAEALHCGLQQMYHPRLINECRRHGVKVRVYTVNSPEDLSYAYSNGIDGVFTNNIKLAQEVRERFV